MRSKFEVISDHPRKETLENKLRDKVTRYLKTQDLWFVKTHENDIAGIPDYLICIKGRFVAIELKVKDNSTTELQENTLKLIHEAGGYSCVCYTLEDVKDVVNFLLTSR